MITKYTQRKPNQPLTLQHIFERCDTSGGPDSCWAWQGGVDRWGYGKAKFAGWPKTGPHRLVLFLIHGQENLIGKHAMHSCNNTICCNPKHLSIGTCKENQEERASRITHCKWGHKFTPENTYTPKPRHGWTERQCRRCMTSRGRIYQLVSAYRSVSKNGTFFPPPLRPSWVPSGMAY